ncbi:MAG: polyprenyl synthetase family protein [Bacteroidales bacterium]|nr:polyprenyl synthetase family protein [Bacteroidales bacterium]
MNKLSEIKSPISSELKTFNDLFSKTMKSSVPLLNIITNYVLRRKGKQIRPVLVFLTAKMIGEINQTTYTAASLVELLHTATLVHDDVVDEAYERRGFLSINALWKSKIAVLLGDYLLSRGLAISVETKEYDILEITNEAVKEMIEGELLQIQKSRKLNIKEEDYFRIIKKKTATLLAACTASGARSVTTDPDMINKMKVFGLHIGVAFQIKDDLFDYEKTSITGKPKGNDLQEKKLTLPLIASLNKANKADSKSIIRLINNKSSKKDTFQKVYDFVHKYEGVKYAEEKMIEYRQNALEILNNFQDNKAKESLKALVNFIVERKN